MQLEFYRILSGWFIGLLITGGFIAAGYQLWFGGSEIASNLLMIFSKMYWIMLIAIVLVVIARLSIGRRNADKK